MHACTSRNPARRSNTIVVYNVFETRQLLTITYSLDYKEKNINTYLIRLKNNRTGLEFLMGKSDLKHEKKPYKTIIPCISELYTLKLK